MKRGLPFQNPALFPKLLGIVWERRFNLRRIDAQAPAFGCPHQVQGTPIKGLAHGPGDAQQIPLFMLDHLSIGPGLAKVQADLSLAILRMRRHRIEAQDCTLGALQLHVLQKHLGFFGHRDHALLLPSPTPRPSVCSELRPRYAGYGWELAVSKSRLTSVPILHRPISRPYLCLADTERALSAKPGQVEGR